MNRMKQRAEQCSNYILGEDNIHIISHIDADGLTSAAIMCKALERAGKNYSVDFIRQLTNKTLKQISDSATGLVVFTDLGSGMLNEITESGIDAVIADHHKPVGDHPYLLNPHSFGINGSQDLSGSGTTFILSMAMGDNVDLSSLAVVGAIGDMQQWKTGALTGVNQQIVDLGISYGSVAFQKDLTLFGKQTRPIYKMLQYNSDPYIPGLSSDADACIAFVKKAGVHMHGEKWLRWIDINDVEKKSILSALLNHAMLANIPNHKINRLVGNVYTLPKETEGTEMRDCTEFSTLLNATARYNHGDVGLAVCMGDRGHYYESACTLLANHRKNLVDGISLVRKKGITKLSNLQYFDAGSQIKDTIVGIIAGMSQSIVGDRNLPIIAFADSKDEIKISGRGNYDLVRKGLNLAAAMHTCSTQLGGSGGGHDIAAGAYIPAGTKEEFIRILNNTIGEQINRS